MFMMGDDSTQDSWYGDHSSNTTNLLLGCLLPSLHPLPGKQA